MLVDRGIVRVGLEIEIPAWNNGRNYAQVVKELIDAEYMIGPASQWEEVHRYRCRCERGCMQARSGEVYIPTLVSATYDASLPAQGAEFVTSAIILSDGALEGLKPIWSIVTKDAVWTKELPNLRGTGYCSPSVHVHASVYHADDSEFGYIDENAVYTIGGDMLHALWRFSPEFLLLADTATVRRGLAFRQFLRQSDEGGHHGFVHIRNQQYPQYLHIEWRLFEATYDDWEYTESSIYTSAGLTRMLTEPGTMEDMLELGLRDAFDPDILTRAVKEENVDAVLELASRVRLTFLRDRLLQHLDDDPQGREAVIRLFNQAERRL